MVNGLFPANDRFDVDLALSLLLLSLCRGSSTLQLAPTSLFFRNASRNASIGRFPFWIPPLGEGFSAKTLSQNVGAARFRKFQSHIRGPLLGSFTISERRTRFRHIVDPPGGSEFVSIADSSPPLWLISFRTTTIRLWRDLSRVCIFFFFFFLRLDKLIDLKPATYLLERLRIDLAAMPVRKLTRLARQ